MDFTCLQLYIYIYFVSGRNVKKDRMCNFCTIDRGGGGGGGKIIHFWKGLFTEILKIQNQRHISNKNKIITAEA